MRTKFKETEIGMIPENWSVVKQKDIARFINGRAYSYEEFRESGTPIIRIQNLTGTKDFVCSDLQLEEEKYVEKGDLIYAWSATFGPYVWKGPRAIFHYHIWKILCDESRLDKFFFYYKLKHISNRVSNTGTGSIFTHITKKLMEDSLISLPSISEQHSIAKILSDLDSKIELNQNMNKTLEEIGQAIFKHWFIDFEFPNEEGKPYKSSGGKMVYNEEMDKEIPKGWKIGIFSDLVNNIKISLKPGAYLQGRKYIPIELLPMHKIGIENYREYTEAKSSLIAFEEDDILFGAMRPYFHRVNISPFSGITRTTVFVLRPRKREYLCYALFYLSLNSSIDYANAHSTGSTIPYAVWSNSLEVMPTLLPDEEQLSKFNKLVYPLIDKIKKSFFELQSLSEIRDSLLPKLISGKIRVPVETN